jgi:hypothetical protein
MRRSRKRSRGGSGIHKLLAIGYRPEQLIAMGYCPHKLHNANIPPFGNSKLNDDLPRISIPKKLPGIDDPVGLVALMDQLEIDDRPPELLSRSLPQSQISDFTRKITVKAGLIMFYSTNSAIKTSKSHFWIPSSFQTIERSLFQFYEPLRLITFEFGSKLECIEQKAFAGSRLKMIQIPASVKVLCISCFQFCQSLRFVTFECESKLERIEENAFENSGLETVILPASLNFLGETCFSHNEQLKSVIFESGSNLRRTGKRSFSSSNGLESVIIPASVEVVDSFSFCHCSSLQSVEFETGSRVEQIEQFAFSNTSLTELTLPNSLHFISGSALAAVHLRSVSFLPSSSMFYVKDHMIEDISGLSITRYFGSNRSIEIAKCVEMIGEGCFFQNRFVESITFETGSRLEQIGKSAFEGTKLKGLFVIPRSVKILSERCFAWIQSLESIVFESGSELKRIEERTFLLSGLKVIVIPISVEQIGPSAFDHCELLESVTFESESRLQQLGECAFDNSGLESIVIPVSVEVIKNRTFAKFQSLESVTFETGSRLQ